ncbi:MAG TPA: hypothetical protein VMY39_05310, partial [Planctomycetota bacterium]|nr:hypothetical protein [Planctomycetota bacterium]
MKRAILSILVLLVAGVVLADEQLSSEEFVSLDTLRFGPDNVTRDALRSRALTTHPFNRVLELPSGAEIVSEPFRLGPAARGRIEDVVWLRLSEGPEEGPGRRAGFTGVAFEGGGPEVRILRTTTRPTATVEWFDGAAWQQSGATLALNREYRLRTVIDLDLGSMDIHLREEPDGQEWPVAQGRTFRAFADPQVRRRFALGRPSAMKVAIAAWQIWRVGQNEFIRQGPGQSDETAAAAVMRYAAPAELTGDAVRLDTAGGTTTYTLAPARGLADDMELPDISRWTPPTRVQRQNRLRFGGQWALSFSEGARPVDTPVTLPHGDFDLRLRFLVPTSLPANRQIYLVRFKNTATAAEPVGPSIYLDYGAAGDGKSFVICQLRPDSYYAQEVEVQPGRWYGLRLETRRARSAYLGWFIADDGTEVPLNQGQELSFFLGTSVEDDVQWRFFSIVSMRTGVSGWPKIELERHERRLQVQYDAKEKARLAVPVLRGLPLEAAKDVELTDWNKVYSAVYNKGEIISKTWPSFRITAEDAAKFDKRYAAFLITATVYLPWPGTKLSAGADGSMWPVADGRHYKPPAASKPDEFTALEPVEANTVLRGGAVGLAMAYVPRDATAPRAELRWMHPPDAQPPRHDPIPPELFTGTDVVLRHPGAARPMSGAAVLDDKVYLSIPANGLEIYDRQWLRTRYRAWFFTKATGNRSYVVSAFAWDPWEACFWLYSGNARKMVKLDRELAPTDLQTRLYYFDAVAMAAGPDAIYLVSKEGKVLRCDKFFATRRGLPMDKMFGGEPLVGAIVCVDRFLYLALREDSPIHPATLVCVDTRDWNPVFSVNLRDGFPHVTALATDGKRMFLFDDASSDVGSFKLPPPGELEPQDTFLYL